jgi:hypothetical protein
MAKKTTPPEVVAFFQEKAGQRQQVEGQCDQCGEPFQGTTRRQYCSHACAQRAYQQRRNDERKRSERTVVLHWQPLPDDASPALLALVNAQRQLERERGQTRYLFVASPSEDDTTALRLSQRFLPSFGESVPEAVLNLLVQRGLLIEKGPRQNRRYFTLSPTGRDYFADRARADGYAKTAIHYYVLGRWGALRQLLPTAAVLLHHGAEFLMKMPYAAAGLKDGHIMEKLGRDHDLLRLWDSFRADVIRSSELDEFAMFLEQLSGWEEVRYPPDGVLAISVNEVSDIVLMPAEAEFAEHSLVVNIMHIDAMFKAMMRLLGVTREYVLEVLSNRDAVTMYATMNEHQLA